MHKLRQIDQTASSEVHSLRHNPMHWSSRNMLGLICALMTGFVMFTASAANAASCTREDFDQAVDTAGEDLRTFNAVATPKLWAKIKQLKARKGWTGERDEQLALDYLHDARIASFDAKANTLLTSIDTLGQPPEGAALDCTKLTALKAASIELLAVMKAKSAHLSKRIDGELTAGGKAVSSSKSGDVAYRDDPQPSVDTDRGTTKRDLQEPPPPPEPTRSDANDAATTAAATETTAAAKQPDTTPKRAPAPKKAPANQSKTDGWEAATQPSAAPDVRDDYVALQRQPGQTGAAGTFATTPTGQVQQFDGFEPDRQNGYSIDEIQQATRGFFGKISTGLASVIEYSFKNWGRPTGYVLGKEGGGAFLAGLRYGSGNLYLRSGKTSPIYWHGPSVGYDFGAEGSRTMFLIYRLQDTAGMYRTFTGVDGSAFLVGGVGLTILKGGKVIMAPIRSGLGLRLGANIGYLRFTPRPTWNPF